MNNSIFHVFCLVFNEILPMTVLPGRSGARPGPALHGRAGSHQETGVNGRLCLTRLRRASETGGMSALCLAETTLQACITSGTFLQTLPELVTPLKGLSLSLLPLISVQLPTWQL